MVSKRELALQGADRGRIERIAAAEAAASVYEVGGSKHFVRVRGWLDTIERYQYAMREEGVARTLKYLTLPGVHAIDVGLLHRRGLIVRNDDGVLNVAICDKENAEQVAASLAKIGKVIAFSSKPLHLELGSEKSALTQAFPFDVINCDLTGALIPANKTTPLEMLDQIFQLQCGQEFLLLITTRVEEASHDRLLELVRSNLEQEPTFRSTYVDRFGDSDAGSCRLNNRYEFEHIAIAKYVALVARHYAYSVREEFVGNYERTFQHENGGKSYRMICHSFWFSYCGTRGAARFAPRFKRKPRGLQDGRFKGNPSSTAVEAAAIAYRDFVGTLPVRSTLDIDCNLAADPALRATLEAEAQALIGWQDA